MTPADLDALAIAIRQTQARDRDKRCDGANALKRLRQRVGPVEVEKGIKVLKTEGRV
jgi:hypothetical protein